MKAFGLKSIMGDGYGQSKEGGWITAGFQRNGITYVVSPMNRSQIYLEFQPLVNQGAVRLLDHAEALRELRVLERRARATGDLVDHPRGGHDDQALVTAGALVQIAQVARTPKSGFAVSTFTKHWAPRANDRSQGTQISRDVWDLGNGWFRTQSGEKFYDPRGL